MQAPMKQTPIGQRQPLKGLAWFVAVAYLFLAPFKFSPVGILVLLMTGAVTTHIVDHNLLADNFSSPVMLVLVSIVALANWPADWREPLALGRRGEARVPVVSQHS